MVETYSRQMVRSYPMISTKNTCHIQSTHRLKTQIKMYISMISVIGQISWCSTRYKNSQNQGQRKRYIEIDGFYLLTQCNVNPLRIFLVYSCHFHTLLVKVKMQFKNKYHKNREDKKMIWSELSILSKNISSGYMIYLTKSILGTWIIRLDTWLGRKTKDF